MKEKLELILVNCDKSIVELAIANNISHPQPLSYCNLQAFCKNKKNNHQTNVFIIRFNDAITNEIEQLEQLKTRYPQAPLIVLGSEQTLNTYQKKIISLVDDYLFIEDFKNIHLYKSLLLIQSKQLHISKNDEKNNIYENGGVQKSTCDHEIWLKKSEIIGNTGSWKYNIEQKTFYFNHKASQIFRLPKGKNSCTLDFLYEQIHPEDRKGIIKEIKASWPLNRINIEYRLCINDTVIWLALIAKTRFNTKGEAIEVIGSVKDITYKKETVNKLKLFEKKIRYNEQLKNTVLQILTEGLLIQDDANNVLYANRSACEILGLSMDQLQGKTSYDPLWAAYDEYGNELAAEDFPSIVVLKTGKPVTNFVMSILNGKGERKTIKVTSQPLFGSDKQTKQVISTIFDITPEIKQQQLLKDSENVLNGILTLTKVGCWEYFVENQKIKWEDEMYNIFGIDKHVKIDLYTASLQCFKEEDRAHILNSFNQCVQLGQGYTFTLPITDHNGIKKWIRSSGIAVYGENGQIKKVVGTVKDVSHSVKNKMLIDKYFKQASKSKKRFQVMFEQTNTGVALADAKGKLSLTNNAFQNLLGYTEHELYKLHFSNLTHPDDRKKEAELLKGIIEEGKGSYRIEKRYICKDGRTIWVDLSLAAIRDQDGNIENFIGVVTNIAKRKKYELDLALSKSQLQGLINSTRHEIFSIDENYLIQHYNTRWAEELKKYYDIDIYIGMPILEQNSLHPELKNTLLELFNAAFNNKESHIETEILSTIRHKLKKHTIIDAYPLINQCNHIFGAAIYIEDISAQKAYEQKLKASKEKYRFLTESIKHPIWRSTAKGQIEYLNQYGYDVFGIQVAKKKLNGLIFFILMI